MEPYFKIRNSWWSSGFFWISKKYTSPCLTHVSKSLLNFQNYVWILLILYSKFVEGFYWYYIQNLWKDFIDIIFKICGRILLILYSKFEDYADHFCVHTNSLGYLSSNCKFSTFLAIIPKVCVVESW